MKSLKTIFQSILISLCACGGLGFILGLVLYFWAQYRTSGMRPDQAASYLCSAGMAPIGLALLGTIIGSMIGAVVGVTLAMMEKVETSSTQLRLEK
jgi:hypothetical protein